ncbi:MAG: hypothetical protein ABSH46_10375 [Bryobacteraceae bacterium]
MLGLRLRNFLNFMTFLAVFASLAAGGVTDKVNPRLARVIICGVLEFAPITLLVSAIRSRRSGIAVVYHQLSRQHRGYEVITTYSRDIETNGKAAHKRLVGALVACGIVTIEMIVFIV